MQSFGEHLHQARRPEWSDHYLDYSELKRLLARFYERRSKVRSPLTSSYEIERFFPDGGLPKTVEDAEISSSESGVDFDIFETGGGGAASSSSQKDLKDIVSRYEREEFCFALDQQVDQITTFYLAQVALLNHKLASTNLAVKSLINGRRTGLHEEGLCDLTQFEAEFRAIGDELLEMFVFVTANITALNQILIRYDGRIRIYDGPPLGRWYIMTRREGYFGTNFHAFLSYKALLRLSGEFLVSIQSISVQIHQDKQYSSEQQTETDNFDSYVRTFSNKLSIIESYLCRAEQALGEATDGRLMFSDSILYNVKKYFVAGSRLNDIILQPGFMRTRGKYLTEEIQFCATWRRKGGNIDDSKDINATPRLENLRPLIIILMSQVLSACNHYIIEPSSTKYIHEMGGHDALSGVLIGMTPWANVLAAFAYSMWSNHSFKQPLICSGIMLALGSLVYGSALKFHSIPVAMAGRILTGLGGPCAINRRYIADTVPSDIRTAVSASFATAGAIGMSMGPALAIALDCLDFELVLPFVGKIEVNGMTGPGYFMFICWIIYLTVVIWKFEEPERTGLRELKDKERHSRRNAQYQPPVRTNSSSSALALRNKNSGMLEDDVCYDSDAIRDSDVIRERKSSNPLTRYVNQATVVCMSFVFLGKFVLEMLNSSNSLVTRHRYDWSVRNIGTLGLANGMLVIPVSTTVGFLSQRYTDRALTTVLLLTGFFGVFLLVDVTDFRIDPEGGDGYNEDSWASVGPWRFVMGQMITFSGLNAFESVAMSMLSKVVPFRLAKGTFNAGFLTSIFVSLGRACGDAFITWMGLISLRYLLNLLAIPCLAALSICLTLLCVYRDKLSV